MIDLQVDVVLGMQSVDYFLVDLLKEEFGLPLFLSLSRTLFVVIDRDYEHILVTFHKRRDIFATDSRYKKISFDRLSSLYAGFAISSVVRDGHLTADS